MATPYEAVVSAIEEKWPLVLLLGQDAWRENGQEDPVLAQALAHLQRDEAKHAGWRRLLDSSPLPPTFHEWLAERFERRVAPDWLRVLGKVSWSAVFTSSLDPTLKALFSERQHPELVLTNAETPRAARSRNRPPIYHLFGHAASLDPRARPPLSRDELNTRRINDAVPLLGRLLDTATRLGLILVDGVVAERDWLRIDDVLGAIGNAGRHQVIWFKGRTLPLPDDEDFTSAISASRLTIVDERLSTVITQLLTARRFADLLVPEPETSGTITFGPGHFLDVSPEERLHVEAVASIVDDAWLAPLAPLGKDAERAAFGKFHGELGSPRSLVDGVRRGFALKREYEHDLQELVTAAINDHSNVDTPLILHGQSATGKSIALARIAGTVPREAKAAVLYSKNRIPQPYEVAPFCGRAERAGAKATLIICDANQDVRPYGDLLSGLKSRGHRVVVLGSRYLFIDDQGGHLKTTIEAPSTLSEGEQRGLASLLDRFAGEQVPSELLKDNHVLSFLYRALALTRYQIGSGLAGEAHRTEQMVREHRAEYLKTRPPRTLLAKRLREAGIESTDLFDERQRQAIDSDDDAAKIIDLVMAAGSLGCPVPFNLLFRLTVGGRSLSSPTEVAKIFGGLDLFRWHTDEESNDLLVSARLALEAELICRRRLGSAVREAECIIDLLGAVRNVGIEREHERRFLFRALGQLGPNGRRGTRYKAAYERVARTLTELRTHYGITDASVVLQESAFRRYAVRENAVEQDARMTLLTEAREAIQTTIDDIAKGALIAPRRTQRFLKVELASLYGFIAYGQADAGRSNDDIWTTYLAARSSVRQVVSVTDSYFPMDVGLWTPSDLLQKCEMEDWRKAELIADIHDTLDQIDLGTLTPTQRDRFDMRRFKTGYAIGDPSLSETAFQELTERGSPAGCYLRARQIAPDWRDHAEKFSADERERARHAADFLDDHPDLIAQDVRSLSLLLECRWISELGRRPFVGQRQPLPATHASARLFLDLVQRLNEACGENPRNASRYLAATLTWLSGGEKVADDLFRGLARDTDYEDGSRVIQRHLITDTCGQPKQFNGRVEAETHPGNWKVRLDELGQLVRLRSRDFPPGYEIAYGRQVGGFGVAFNFIGPIATSIKGR